jgi:hypothetical protein
VKKENQEYRVKLDLLENKEPMGLPDPLVLEVHLVKMDLMAFLDLLDLPVKMDLMAFLDLPDLPVKKELIAFLDLPDLPVKKELMEPMELLDPVEHLVQMV